MDSASGTDKPEPQTGGHFETTHWSLVLQAGHVSSSGGPAALAQLCQTYWPPLYAYARRKGHGPHDAQDLTQDFFSRLLEDNFFSTADRAKGRFRSFLLTAFNNFLINEWVRGQAQKRGGGQVLIPLDMEGIEATSGAELAHHLTPERAFERRWVLALLEKVVRRLQDEYVSAGRAELFGALRGSLSGEALGKSYAEVAQRLGMSEGAVKVAVHRLRQRYRELLRAEIANTVASPDEVDDELRHLFAALGT